MVKKMDDYNNRMDDRRFEKFDRAITGNENDKKFATIITIGLIISFLWLVGSLFLESQKPPVMKYDYGLNISYSPESSSYFIDYTNPNNTATSLIVDIKIPLGKDYQSVYSREVKEFPTNISYRPSNSDYNHIVSVNIIKQSGNYTYFYSNVPSDDDKMYNGLFKYTEPFNNVIS